MKNILVSSFVAALMATGASAATLSASSGNDSVSDFTIDFNDDGDGLLQLSEITSFSGVSAGGDVFDQVAAVATISGVSSGSGGTFWIFANAQDSQYFNQSNWTYDVSGLAAVPLPASAPLALAGLLALGWLRRRQG